MLAGVAKDDVYEKDLKDEIYQQLDAELRRTGRIAAAHDPIAQEMKAVVKRRNERRA